MMCRGMWSGQQIRGLFTLCLLVFGLTTCAHQTAAPESPQARGPADAPSSLSVEAIRLELDSPEVMPEPSSVELPACEFVSPLPMVRKTVDVWWWHGEKTPEIRIEAQVRNAPCSLEMTSGTAWIKPKLMPGGHGITLSLQLDQVPTGRHRAAARIGNPNHHEAWLELDVRVFQKAPSKAKKKVLVVGLDGVRADCVVAARTPTIDFLARRAAYSFEAQTQRTGWAKSGPGWASVLTGVETRKHRVHSNKLSAIARRSVDYPTFLERAQQELGLKTACGVHWEPILKLSRQETLHASWVGSDKEVSQKMSNVLTQGQHDIHFLHLNDPDDVGHKAGFSVTSTAYLGAISQSDKRISDLLDAILSRPDIGSEDWLIIVTTDHGGSSHYHGVKTASNQTIFFVAAGTSLSAGKIQSGSSHLDVHPTVTRFLGIRTENEWKLDGQARGVEPL